MKRKHEDSPGRSTERSRKIPAYVSRGKSSGQLGRSHSLSAVLKTNKNNFGSNGLRRSSRKATIERRVWAEPRKERPLKLHKDYNNVSKRGRPRKKVRETKVPAKSAKKEALVNNSVISKRPKKNGNYNECLSDKKSQDALANNDSENGTSFADVEMSFTLKEETEEGTLIVDDEVASLQGAVVDEVIEDYPQEAVPNPPINSHCKPNLLLESFPNSSSTKYTNDIKDTESGEVSFECDEEKRDERYKNDFCDGKENISDVQPNADHSDDSVRSEPKVAEPRTNENFTASEDILRIDETVEIEKEERILENSKEDSSQSYSETTESRDDDNHVSLSEALAKLVDSEESGQGSEADTVTIHPFPYSEEDKASFNSHLRMEGTFPIQSLMSSSFSSAVKVSISEASSNFASTKDSLSNSSSSLLLSSDIKADENEILDSDEKESANTDSSCSEENSQSEPISFEFPHTKQPIPSLIKISSKPPVIKIPLKCSECPMRFCTVRSLLWHFGTHEPSGKSQDKGEVLLEDLFTTWDSPDVPIHIPKTNCNQEKKLPLEPPYILQDFPSGSIPSSVEAKGKTSKYTKVFPNENGLGVNRDFILKVPIPRLKHKKVSSTSPSESSPLPDADNNSLPATTSSSCSHFVSILPKPPSNAPLRTSSPEPVEPRVPSLSSRLPNTTAAPFTLKLPPPTYQMVEPIRNGTELALPSSGSHQSSLFTQTLSSSSSSSCSASVLSFSSSWPPDKTAASSSSSFHTSSPPSTTTTTTTTCPSTSSGRGKGIAGGAQPPITVIPVEKLSQLRQQIQNGSAVTAAEKEARKKPPADPLPEKDGLVMINQNLALRIVSTHSGPLEAKSSNSDPAGGQPCSNSLTILPQSKSGNGVFDARPQGVPTPDILTIVPQSDPGKQSSKTATPPHLMTAMGKVTPDASQVVKLILLPPKEEPLTAHEGSRASSPRKTRDEGSDFEESDEESDEGGMVIDVKEDEASMDPLSLCAVTMEEEDAEPPPPPPPGSPPMGTSPQNFISAPHHHPRVVLPATPFPGVQSPNQEPGKRPLLKVDDEKYQRRKYVCHFCQKRFGWSTDLKRHVILHTGERPFKCKWCPITFTRKFLLQNHMKKIHSQLCKWSDLWE